MQSISRAIGLWVLAALALVALSAQDAMATAVPFAPQSVIVQNAFGARSAFAADMDRDGDMDVLWASENTIAWYENNGAVLPMWTEHSIFDSPFGGGAVSVVAADMDGDGDLDVLGGSDNKISWYENTRGAAPEWTDHPVFDSPFGGGATSIAASDLDGDGDMDILGSSVLAGQVVWYENNGPFSPPFVQQVIGPGGPSVFAADVDGDGDTDILSGSSWYENNGASTPGWTARTISPGGTSLFAADLDGDGDTDVLSAGGNTIAWSENNGASPPVWTARTVSTVAGGPASVFAADMDGDGDLDAVSANFSTMTWYENNGAFPPVWTARTISNAQFSGGDMVFTADLDGDADLDVLSASESFERVVWYQNRTIHRSAYYLPQRLPLPAALLGPWSVHAADLDRDGDLDVVSASGMNPAKLAWYENNGASFPSWTERTISTATNGDRSVFAADLDGDGDLDVLSASEFAFGNKIAWYDNDGASPPVFTERSVSAATTGARSVFAADIDGDGDLDVLSASFDDDTIAWYQNSGAMLPSWTRRVISTAADGARAVYALDLDGDGDVDVLSASEVNGNSKVAWYVNSGATIPAWTEQVITTTAPVPQSVFGADINQDGRVDVLVASAGDSTIAWYENNGTSTWKKKPISTLAAFALSATAADLDGDGDPDVLSASFNDDTVAWYENVGGDPIGWVEHVINVTADGAAAAVPADLDGDGKLDVLSCSGNDGAVSWYRNRGGQFALSTTDVTPPLVAPDSMNALLNIVVAHRGRPGDTDLELATLELRFEHAGGAPLTTTEANALVESLSVYVDSDSDGAWSPADSQVALVESLSLADGRQTVPLADGDPNVRVMPGTGHSYFVVVSIAADAPLQATNDFRVIHLTESSSTAEDVSADIPLSLEAAANVSSGLVSFPPRVVSVVPQDHALAVPVGSNVTVVFSEPVLRQTVTPSTFRLLDPEGAPVAASVGLAPDGMTATLDPSPAGGALAFRILYTVDVSGIKDLASIPNVPFSSRFVTAATPVSGKPLPSVSDQSVLPGPPPAPFAGGLSSTEALSGSTVGPNLGFSVTAAGDLNNDALADFLGGAPGYGPGGMAEAGAAAIYLGSNAPEPPSGNHPREVADVIFTGQAAHDRAGTSVAGGFDFNGDGVGDILIGAEQVNRTVDPPEITGTGKVYLIFFKPLEYDFDHNSIPDYLERSEVFVSLSQVGAGISGVVFTGAAPGDQAGYAVASGSRLESSDARDDIVIGAPGAGNDDGRVYVVFSSSGVSGVTSLAGVGTGIAGVTYVGSSGERLGSSVALPGDLIDPAGPDIALGAPLADTTQSAAGRVYVAAAGSLVAGMVNAAATATQIHGDQACEGLGFSVSGGGDNRAGGTPALSGGDLDLLIGAPYYDAIATPGDPCLDTTPAPNAGRVVQTSGRLPASIIGASQVGSTVEGVIWRGVQAGSGLGWSVARLGDLSGNNLDDIGLGAPFSSPGMTGAGAVYVIEGSANTGFLGTIDADQVGQIVSGGIFLGTQLGEEAGLALCAAGDLDGDGLSGSTTADDFTVGSPGWDASLGTVHQVLGTLLQQPGECTALGCTVADLLTGAVLVVPPNALAQGTKFRFQVQGLPSLPASCGSHLLAGKSLIGSSDNSRTDCGAPPCSPPGFAVRPGVEVPTRPELEYQLARGEALALRYCDATFGWTAVPGGPATGLVQDNSFLAGRKAVAASGVDTLRRYGVFFDDLDHDDARDTCDCSPGDATRWSAPGPAGTLLFTAQTPSSSAILTWELPPCMGGAPGVLLYDTIRSTNPSNFVTGAVCVAANDPDTSSVDAVNPLRGQVFYYIVSPENGCQSASVCSDPACVQPPARDC